MLSDRDHGFFITVTDIHAASLACNVGGDKPAALVADAPAGSKVTFNWQNVCAS